MPSQELIARVAELREQGRTPKEIARALGLRPSQMAPLIRAVAEAAPEKEAALVGCWVPVHWAGGLGIAGDHPDWPGADDRDIDPHGMSGLIGVFVAREHGSAVSAAGFLVDLWCMGVKDAWPPKTMSRAKLPEYRGLFFRSFGHSSVRVPLDLAQNLVFGAVEHARGLGLEPHEDYHKAIGHLGEWTGPGDITFGKDGKPFYIDGPHDNALEVISKLRASVGAGNFDSLITGGTI